MRIAGPAHAVFSATLIALGIWGLAGGAFTPLWQPVPKDGPVREALAYLTALVSLASGAGLVWRRSAATAARLLLASLVVWLVLFRMREVLAAPAIEVTWEGVGETLVVIAGVWALFAQFADDWDRRRLGFATGESGARISRRLYGLALVPLGLAHLTYVKETAALVPAWLPWHAVWVWLTGLAYIAAGIALLAGILQRLAASLSALQMGLFTLLVWAPPLAMGSGDSGQWSEGVDSWTLTAAAWVVAESRRGMPWLGLGGRKGRDLD
jgi:uncharacterized membrane protein